MFANAKSGSRLFALQKRRDFHSTSPLPQIFDLGAPENLWEMTTGHHFNVITRITSIEALYLILGQKSRRKSKIFDEDPECEGLRDQGWILK